MRNINSKIKKIRDLLLTVSKDVFHYQAMKKPDQYIVYAEDMEGGSVGANNKKVNQSIQGTIDYFTKTEWDDTADRIQEVLNEACIAFYLNSVQFEEETGYKHFEWVWEVK